MPEDDSEFEDSLAEIENFKLDGSEPFASDTETEDAFEIEEIHDTKQQYIETPDVADPEDPEEQPKEKNKILSIKVPDLEVDKTLDVLSPGYAAECIMIVNAIPDVWKQLDETLFSLNTNLDHIERQRKARESSIRKQIYDEKDEETKKKVFSNEKQRDHAFYVRSRKDKDWQQIIESIEDHRFKVKEFQRQQGRLEHLFKAKRITLRYLSKGGQ